MKVIDGSSVSMPDTVENQKAYPQPSNQKPGCGFPIAKLGVMFNLATGAVIALAVDVLNTHDLKLARKLYHFLNPKDVLLGLECGDKKINQPSLSYLLVYTSYLSGLRAGLFFQALPPRELFALMPI